METVRLKYEYGVWWAYFNGHNSTYMFAYDLPSMCNLLQAIY